MLESHVIVYLGGEMTEISHSCATHGNVVYIPFTHPISGQPSLVLVWVLAKHEEHPTTLPHREGRSCQPPLYT